MLSDSDRADQMGQATREKIRQFIARIERLEGEKSEIAADIREVYAEMKTFGLDTKTMRRLIARRKLDALERAEQEALLGLYEEASQGDLFAAPALKVVTPADKPDDLNSGDEEE